MRYGFMEKAGDRWWPFCGAVYMMTAVKRVRGMRLIGPVKMTKISRQNALAPATQKTTGTTFCVDSLGNMQRTTE